MPEKVIAETGPAEAKPFDPEEMDLELSRIEKLRATALVMAIKYYTETIIKDGALYSAMKAHNEHLEPAKYEKVIDVAIEFAMFLATGLTPAQGRQVEQQVEQEAAAEAASTPEHKP